MYYKRKPKFSKFFAKVCSTKQIWDWDKEKSLDRILQELSSGGLGGGIGKVKFNGKTLEETIQELAAMKEAGVITENDYSKYVSFFEILQDKFLVSTYASDTVSNVGIQSEEPVTHIETGEIELNFFLVDKETGEPVRTEPQVWELYDLKLEYKSKQWFISNVLTYDETEQELKFENADQMIPATRALHVSSFFDAYFTSDGYENLFNIANSKRIMSEDSQEEGE